MVWTAPDETSAGGSWPLVPVPPRSWAEPCRQQIATATLFYRDDSRLLALLESDATLPVADETYGVGHRPKPEPGWARAHACYALMEIGQRNHHSELCHSKLGNKSSDAYASQERYELCRLHYSRSRPTMTMIMPKPVTQHLIMSEVNLA